MKSLLQNTRILFLFSAVFSASSYADKNIQEIIVTSDFRESQLKTVSTSISVIDTEVISQRNSNHLEQILALAPNVNFSAGSNRGRFYQIRGIGERSQFADPLSPSVGTYVDGIDFSGFGGAATLLDIDQVEILRGSQGTRFGANALAGVINLKTADPSAESQGYAKTSLSSYGGRSLETAFGGALNDQWLYRVAVGKTLSDGFINNTTLDRKDTNNIDELTSRLKLRYLAADNLTVDFTALHLDVDNGFDAFSLDENRNTLSDMPGHDRQNTTAFAINSDWTLSDALSVKTIFTTNRSDIQYSFDEDWSFLDLWLDNLDGEGVEKYQGFDSYQREFSRDSGEVRWLSGPSGKIANSDWLIGLYFQKSKTKLYRPYYSNYSEYDDDGSFSDYGEDVDEYESTYETKTSSIFTQIKTPLVRNIALISGLRIESWRSDFVNSPPFVNKIDDTLLGGKLALELTTHADNLLFVGLTRGYKAGGFNAEKELSSVSDRKYDTEYQWNYEVGAKLYSLNGKLSNNITAFYSDRKDLQLKLSKPLIIPGEPVKYLDYIANAGKGYSYGFEWEMTLRLQDNLRINSSLGLLKTKVTEYNNPSSIALNLENREVAHAPEYSFATSLQYDLTKKLTATLEVESKDKFYYSDSHNFQSQAYKLVNARLAYQANGYHLTAYINNATDKDYGVRGYDFTGWDQDPRPGEGYDDVQFEQLGAPRVIGLSLRADF